MGKDDAGNSYVPDQYDKLQMLIGLTMKGKSVYVLAIPREDISPDTLNKLKEMKDIPPYIPVNGTIDFVVSGTEEDAKETARRIYEVTGQNIGCVQYTGENMLSFYMALKGAIDSARREGKSWHLLNPNKDSLSALIEAARKN